MAAARLGRLKIKHQGSMNKPKCVNKIKTGRVQPNTPEFRYTLPKHPREQ